MSQASTVLANNPGDVFRAALNAAIAAVVSRFSGASAPGTPVEGQGWLDTSVSPHALKVYDGASWLIQGCLDASGHLWMPPIGGGKATVASATTTDLGGVPQGSLTISGTTTITSFGSSAAQGTFRFLTFSGVLTLTHHATALILPGGASITTAAGDTAIAEALGSGNWRVHAFTRAAGLTSSAVANASGVSGASVSNALDTLANLVALAQAGVRRGTVRVATTANVTISTALNNGDTLDGVSLVTGNLVLVKNQSAPEQNGVYVVGVSPARAAEFDTYDEHPGAMIAVQEGTANADTLWYCTSNTGGTLNTTAITFVAAPLVGPTLLSLEALSLVNGDLLYATAADTLARLGIGSTNAVLIVSGGVPAWSTGASPIGTRELWVDATQCVARSSNGAAAGQVEIGGTNKVNFKTWDFDAALSEYIVATVQMPKHWDEGQISIRIVWTAGNTGGVVWWYTAVALRGGSSDAIDTAYASEQAVVASIATADTIRNNGGASFTPGGTIANGGTTLSIRIRRDGASGSDTLAVDAKLIGFQIVYTAAAGNDA